MTQRFKSKSISKKQMPFAAVVHRQVFMASEGIFWGIKGIRESAERFAQKGQKRKAV